MGSKKKKTKYAYEISHEFARYVALTANKVRQFSVLYGDKFANVLLRMITTLYTFYASERVEIDYTKWGIWLYPTPEWKAAGLDPLFYYVGISIDHYSRMPLAYIICLQPSTANAIRLWKRTILPKSLWLPARLRHFARLWDAAGVPFLVAMDNAPDLTSFKAEIVFTSLGTIVLLMPPFEGDKKGVVERAQQTFESVFVANLLGHVKVLHDFTSPLASILREDARKEACLTVQEIEDAFVPALLKFADAPHPKQTSKSRIEVYRESRETLRPPILITGKMQIRTTFAMTFEDVTLGEYGVCADTMYFNSDELLEFYARFPGTKVIVKLDPDDVRSVLVIMPDGERIIEAFLVSGHRFKCPISLETYRVLWALAQERGHADYAWDSAYYDYMYEEDLHRMRTGGLSSAPGKSDRSFAQAATMASEMPAKDKPSPPETNQSDWDDFFGRK